MIFVTTNVQIILFSVERVRSAVGITVQPPTPTSAQAPIPPTRHSRESTPKSDSTQRPLMPSGESTQRPLMPSRR